MSDTSSNAESVEKRAFTRVPLKSRAVVRGGGTRLEGEIRDLSLTGLFVVTPGKLKQGQNAIAEMVLAGPSSELVVELAASVVRQDQDGLALRFDPKAFELDAYLHLRNVIAYLKEDGAEAIMKEFYKLLEEQAKEAESI